MKIKYKKPIIIIFSSLAILILIFNLAMYNLKLIQWYYSGYKYGWSKYSDSNLDFSIIYPSKYKLAHFLNFDSTVFGYVGVGNRMDGYVSIYVYCTDDLSKVKNHITFNKKIFNSLKECKKIINNIEWDQIIVTTSKVGNDVTWRIVNSYTLHNNKIYRVIIDDNYLGASSLFLSNFNFIDNKSLGAKK